MTALKDLPEAAAEQLIARCRTLVDIPSVSRDEAAVTEYIRHELPNSLDLVYDHDSVLIAMTPRRPGRPLVVLVGHTDTVPLEDNLPSERRDGRIWGRGTTDMKGGVAVMLELAEWLEVRQTPLAVDLAFLFFGREELSAKECPLIGVLQNTPFLVDAAFALVMEPTDNAVEAGCQGNLNLTLTFRGEAAHSARPWIGINAAHAAIAALHDVALASPHDVMLDDLLFREVINVTEFNAGVARNVLPPSATINLNVRYAPTRDPQQYEDEVVSKFIKSGADVTVLGNARPGEVHAKHPFVKLLQVAGAGAVMPKQAWTNVADFSALGIPAVNFGPGTPLVAHRKDEYIDIDTLVANLAICRTWLEALTPEALSPVTILGESPSKDPSEGHQ